MHMSPAEVEQGNSWLHISAPVRRKAADGEGQAGRGKGSHTGQRTGFESPLWSLLVGWPQAVT